MDGLKILSSPNPMGAVSPNQSINKIGAGDGDFVGTLKDAIGSVDKLQKDADIKIQKMATGQNTNLHETMIAVEKADIARTSFEEAGQCRREL